MHCIMPRIVEECSARTPSPIASALYDDLSLDDRGDLDIDGSPTLEICDDDAIPIGMTPNLGLIRYSVDTVDSADTVHSVESTPSERSRAFHQEIALSLRRSDHRRIDSLSDDEAVRCSVDRTKSKYSKPRKMR